MILINKENHTIHLRNNHLSYVMEILDGKYILHRYIGKPLKDYHTNKEQFFFKRAYYIDASTSIQDASFDEMMLELPTDDNGDYRLPSLRIRKQNEEEYLQLLFKGCSVKKGKDSLEGLPSTYGDTDEVETLELVYEDYNAKIRVFSYYSLFKDRPIIARHQVIENLSDQSIVILDAKSLSLDLPKNKYDWFSLYGTYAKEANEQRFPLHYGIQKIESKTGSSSPQHQPFFALMQENANQFHGEIFGFQLIR